MKKIIVLLLSVATLLFTACEKENKLYNIAIDVQSDFEHDNVKIFIDGHVEADMQATTNHLLGFAGSTTSSRNAGNHQLKVVVNNSIAKTAVFPLNDDLFIGVGYNTLTREINIQYSSKPFPYD